MKVKEGRKFIGRFESKTDLLGAITDFCKKEDIRLGVFSVIGAIGGVSLGYYNQSTHKYIESLRSEANFEIVSCTGNISSKDSEIFIHAHITLADDKGQCFGGHLMQGCLLFAGEYYIEELTGATLERKYDRETGLSLW